MWPASRTSRRNNQPRAPGYPSVGGSTIKEFLQNAPLFDSISDHVVITDPRGILIYANPAAERLTGFSVQEMLGKKPGDLWGGTMGKEFYMSLWNTVAVQKRTFVGTVKNIRKGGKVFYAELRIYPVLDAAGDVIAHIGIEFNITERQQLEDATAMILHRAKSPVSAEHLLIDMLKEHGQNLTAEQKSLLQDMGETNQYIMDILHNLLITSKLKNYPVGLHGQQTSLRSIYETIIAEHAPAIRKKRIQVVLGKNLSLTVATPYLVSGILENLVSNAVKYGYAGCLVELSAKRLKAGIVVMCKDNGPGIPEKDQGSVFMPFFRASNVKNKSKTSSGLGLYTARQIAESLGYSLAFESKKGQGTLFLLTIPRQ